MSRLLYRYTFAAEAIIAEVESALVLAILAAESLHGEAQVRLDVTHFLNAELRSCVIDAGTAAGRDVNRLFAGFMTREFGPDAFTVERVGDANAVAA